jgi:chitinase
VQIGDAARSAIKAAYAAAGVKLMVSVFGATDAPTSGNYDPVALANTVAAWVKQYGLDGVDVDYEVRFFPPSTACAHISPGLQRGECSRWQGRGLVD